MSECIRNYQYAENISDQVRKRMIQLMPGWFDMVDELMDKYEPFESIHNITNMVLKNPGKPLDDIIHEEMYEVWFQYHDDGDDEW